MDPRVLTPSSGAGPVMRNILNHVPQAIVPGLVPNAVAGAGSAAAGAVVPAAAGAGNSFVGAVGRHVGGLVQGGVRGLMGAAAGPIASIARDVGFAPRNQLGLPDPSGFFSPERQRAHDEAIHQQALQAIRKDDAMKAQAARLAEASNNNVVMNIGGGGGGGGGCGGGGGGGGGGKQRRVSLNGRVKVREFNVTKNKFNKGNYVNKKKCRIKTK